MYKLILASSSPYRKRLLSRLGLEFECIAPEVDESKTQSQLTNPQEIAETLAYLKADNIYSKHPDKIVLGSDQVCACEGKIFGKPLSMESAVEQLMFLQGKTHQLITSYAILHSGQEVKHTNITNLTMRKLNLGQVEKYLNFDNPLDCAGAYKLELNGISLMKSIQSVDPTAIEGLPLIALANDLIDIGYTIP